MADAGSDDDHLDVGTESAVLQTAREIAGKAPLAIYGSKRTLNYARDHSTADGLD